MRQYDSKLYLGEHSPKTTQICTCSLCEDAATKEWAEAFNDGLDTLPNTNDLLLAPRIFGYTLGKKLWCQFRIDRIRNITDYGKSGIGEALILPENMTEKEFSDIKGMIQNHSDAMSHPHNERFSDVIADKGESLILLFHGKSNHGLNEIRCLL